MKRILTAKPMIALGVVTGVVTASAIGSKKIYDYVSQLKRKSSQLEKETSQLEKETSHWKGMYYDKLGEDDVAWG